MYIIGEVLRIHINSRCCCFTLASGWFALKITCRMYRKGRPVPLLSVLLSSTNIKINININSRRGRGTNTSINGANQTPKSHVIL